MWSRATGCYGAVCLLTIWFMVDFMVAEETLRVKECQMYPLQEVANTFDRGTGYGNEF